MGSGEINTADDAGQVREAVGWVSVVTCGVWRGPPRWSTGNKAYPIRE